MRDNKAQYLRVVLLADAATCALSGTLSLTLAHTLSAPLGMSLDLLRAAGAVLLAVAAFILFAARNVPALRWPVWAVVIGNAAWVLESVLVALSGSEPLTAVGQAVVIGQAVAVAVIAELEYIGLRKTAALQPSAAQS